MDEASTALTAADEAYLSQLLSGQVSAPIPASMEHRLLDSGLLVRSGGVLRPTAFAMDLFRDTRRASSAGGRVMPGVSLELGAK